jgi:hypothetical protein
VTRVSRGEEKEGERQQPDLAGEGRAASVARRLARARAWGGRRIYGAAADLGGGRWFEKGLELG